MRNFIEKVVVITGGTGGIGSITAELFLKQGAKLVIVDRDEQALKSLVKELQPFGQVIGIQADVTKEEDVQRYVRRTIEEFDRIDVFFNNAGVEGRIAPLVEQNIDDFENVMRVNVQGVFLGLKHVIPEMITNGGGSVINTSSVAGFEGSPGLSPYVASKHAVVGLTKTAAMEYASQNIRVNSIHPAPVNTRMMRSIEDGMGIDQEAMAYNIPLKRYAEPKEIANLVLFLASEKSSFITGAQYRIDGGMGAS